MLLPLDNRAAAAAGVTMYTVSKPAVQAAQRLAFALVARLGARALPGRLTRWQPGLSEDVWAELVRQWRHACGPVEGIAIYQRRQAARDGLTAVLTRARTPVGVVKVRAELSTLAREQDALALVGAARPQTFAVPAPLGVGEVDGIAWSAQSCVFTRPHRPVMDLPDGLTDELAAALAGLDADLPAGWLPGHRDLSPWNLRRDHRGQVWLFDWEDCGPTPRDGDQAYFWGTAQFIAHRALPRGLDPEALRWALELIQHRTAGHPDSRSGAAAAVAALQAALAAA